MGKLKYVQGRVICQVDLEGKNTHQFADGTKIRLERDYNNFNRRETQPVNGIVISAENIPEGSEILISHNALHDSNRLFNYTPLSGSAQASDIKYYSIPEEDCFAWRDNDGTLKPMKNFEFALRVFKPYVGRISFVSPVLMKDVLYITTGKLKNNVCHTLKSSDYEVIYQELDGREGRLIRLRHSEDSDFNREEITATSHTLTDQVNKGELIIGLEPSKAKTLKEYYG